MKHLLVLSQENIELSLYEAASLLELKKYILKENLLFCDIDKKNLNKKYRLSYTRKVFQILFECSIKALEKSLNDYDFSKVYKDNFCLRIHSYDQPVNEADYAKYIWRSLMDKGIKPKVDLDNPRTLIEIFIFKNKAYVCVQLWKNLEDFESRQAHLRPELHPTAMHPKLARALVNISNSDSIIDPFCGAGGILIEAGLMKVKSIGYDIDAPMLKRARINMQHYRISPKLYKLVKKDSTRLKGLKNIVTDLPYGKSSRKTSEIRSLYSRFIKKISGRAVIVFPDFVNYRKILKENLHKKLKVRKTFDSYVHKSLTRKIVVIS